MKKTVKMSELVGRAIQRADMAELGINPTRAKLTNAYRNAAIILMGELKRAGLQVVLCDNKGAPARRST